MLVPYQTLLDGGPQPAAVTLYPAVHFKSGIIIKSLHAGCCSGSCHVHDDCTGTEACVTGTVCHSSPAVSLPDLSLLQGERLVQVRLSVCPCCVTPSACSLCPLLGPASPSASGGSKVQFPITLTPGKGKSQPFFFFSLSPHPTLSPLYTPAIPLLLFFPPTGDVGRVLCSSPPKLSHWSL